MQMIDLSDKSVYLHSTCNRTRSGPLKKMYHAVQVTPCTSYFVKLESTTNWYAPKTLLFVPKVWKLTVRKRTFLRSPIKFISTGTNPYDFGSQQKAFRTGMCVYISIGYGAIGYQQFSPYTTHWMFTFILACSVNNQNSIGTIPPGRIYYIYATFIV